MSFFKEVLRSNELQVVTPHKESPILHGDKSSTLLVGASGEMWAYCWHCDVGCRPRGLFEIFCK